MGFDSLVAYLAAAGCLSLAVFVVLREDRSLPNLAFTAAMVGVSASVIFCTLAVSAAVRSEIVFWALLGILAKALSSAAWLLFSLSFARSNYAELVRRWRWVVAGAFFAPLAILTLGQDSVFISTLPGTVESSLLPLGWAGKALYLIQLLVSVAVLAHLEATLRASFGSKRWRIKFMLIGVGAYFGVRIYLSGEALLYSSLDLLLEPVHVYAALVLCALAALSLARLRETIVRIHVARSFVYNSAAVFAVAFYLIGVGIIAELLQLFGGNVASIATIVAFLLLVGLAVLMLSGRVREGVKRFIVRNFYSHGYDYRKEWNEFARESTSLLDPQGLCAFVSRRVSQTFGADSVTIWRVDESSGRVILAGSTVVSAAQVQTDPSLESAARELVGYLGERNDFVDFDDPPTPEGERLAREITEFLRMTQARFLLPLHAAGKTIGFMALNERVTGEAFGLEDTDLLRTIADQTAASLLNLELSERLAEAKEMEAFQTLSSFFVHDLKNLASMLSLTVQNLPKNYENPEFRKDALRVIAESVEKMNAMCTRLSTLGQTLDLDLRETDLNALVRRTLSGLNGALRIPLVEELGASPRVRVDAEQIERVLTNLVLNANDAIEGQGEIRVSTGSRNGWATLSVADTGRGMTADFIGERLFRPFQTTKSKGLGIGLFQSKHLVESHGGRIEVESVEGRGSVFRVLLPEAGGVSAGPRRLS